MSIIDLEQWLCTDGHLQTHERGANIRYCIRQLRDSAYNSFIPSCNQPLRRLTGAEEAAFRLGGESALLPFIAWCKRCGLRQGAWAHSSGAACHEYHDFEPVYDHSCEP